MRIKWNSNFNIKDSVVQLAEAYIKIIRFQNLNDKAEIEFIITDFNEDVLAKKEIKIFERNFNNETEVYLELLNDFPNSEIIEI